MKQSASTPSLGALAEQPLGWHQGAVHCEQHHNSASVSRWAGKLRRFDADELRRKKSGDQKWSGENYQQLPDSPRPPATTSPLALNQSVGSFPLRSNSHLSGVSSRAQAENVRLEKRRLLLVQSASAGPAIVGGRKRSMTDNSLAAPDDKRFQDQADRLGDKISEIKDRHQTFQPMTAQQRARNHLFARSASRGLAGNAAQMASGFDAPDEEHDSFEDKLEAWKYVRKIEPELPPLIPLPSQCEPFRPDQHVVKFNARSDVLQRHSPESRMEWMAYKSISREAHHCAVSLVRKKRLADFLAKRKADAEKAFEAKAAKNDEAEEEAGEDDE